MVVVVVGANGDCPKYWPELDCTKERTGVGRQWVRLKASLALAVGQLDTPIEYQ